MAFMLCDKMAMRGSIPPVHGPFELYNKEFVQKCYLDECLLQAKDIWILRAYLQTPNNQLATTHIPTLESFALHTLDPDTVHTFRALNLDGYFSLPAWGPDIQRAYEVIHTYDPRTGDIRITDFDGVQVRIPLTAQLIKRALNFGDALLFTETRFTKEINKETSDCSKPKFSQLKHQRVKMALQLFTQHFKLCYPQKFTKPETRIAKQFTLAAIGSPEARKDFSDFFFKEIKNARSYKAKRGLYLGGVLALTRIAYMGLGRINNLPPPLATTEQLAWKFIRSSHFSQRSRSPSPSPASEDDDSNDEEDEGECRDDDRQRAAIDFLSNCSRIANHEEQELYRKACSEMRRQRIEGDTLPSLKDYSLIEEPLQVYMDIPTYINAERLEVINLDEPSLDDLYQQEEEERLRKQEMENANFQRQAEEQADIKKRLEAQQLAVEEELRKQQLEAQRREQEGLFKLAEIKRKQEDQKLREQQLFETRRQQEASRTRERQRAFEEEIRKQQVETQEMEEERLLQPSSGKRKPEAWQVRKRQIAAEENFRLQQVGSHRSKEGRLLKQTQEAQQLRVQQLAVEEDIRRQHVEAQKREVERLIKWKQEALRPRGLTDEEDMRNQQVEALTGDEERILKLLQEEHLEVEQKLKGEEDIKLRKVEEKMQKRRRIRLLLRQHLRTLVRQRRVAIEEPINQKTLSSELHKDQLVKVEAVARAQAVDQLEVERMDIDVPLKDLLPKKRKVDTSSPNGTKRVHFSEDADTNTTFLSSSRDFQMEQEQLRKEVREGMKQIFSNIGTNVFQQFKVPQAEENKEKIYTKVANLLNRTVDVVGKPIPGTALAKCFSEGAVDLCTTSLFENIFQMQAIVQIRETTLNRMIAALQQQLEETVIAVAKESREKDVQSKMTAIALEKLSNMQAEKEEMGHKVETLLMEVRADEAKRAAMMHELNVLQAQKDILQKYLRESGCELQATKATLAQFRAALLEKELEIRIVRDNVSEAKVSCGQTLLDENFSPKAKGVSLEVEQIIGRVTKENTALQQKLNELESKLQSQLQPHSQALQFSSQETGMPSPTTADSWHVRSPKETNPTVTTLVSRQRFAGESQNEVENCAAMEAQVGSEGRNYELYKLAKAQCTVESLGKLLYTLPKALLIVHSEMQLKQWDETYPDSTRGGYRRHTSDAFQAADAVEVQPPWRMLWFKQHPEHLEYYLQCPREQRVSSTFCPVPRRHNWKEFKKIQESNPEALNYPSLPETEEGQELTEEWFVSKIDAIEREYEAVPDPTILMLLKILHMLKVCIEGFEDVKLQTNWHAFDFFGAGLAFTFGLGPMECQLHGYFARLQYLPAHYLNTFEEAFVTNFFKQGASFVFGPQPELVHHRWVVHQQFLKAFNGAARPKRNFEQENRYKKIRSALRFSPQLSESSLSELHHQKWQLRRQRQQNRRTKRWKLATWKYG
ncbi:hypothetical protein GOP47_0019317 [Adiantum capillus-veneris]|uniref:Uncharacterized protein n=1 Tax=Adiantum capillus-veneris TaxID=13818 RepID=A0A9D4UFT9_ADICA|nr:hypothetical protein GOP47_0019317 [Adiantum capillus-veneris]